VEITLPVVRGLLREVLGFDSFVAGFIRKVDADEKVPTACINREGNLRYSPEFVKEYVTTREDLFCLVFHELLHPFFRHYAYGGGRLENIACDAVINAVISLAFSKHSGTGSLFQKLYESEGIEQILRPSRHVDVRNSRYMGIYSSLYTDNRAYGKLTTGEVIQSLKVLAQGVNVSVILLLGTHGKEAQGKGRAAGGSSLPEEVLAGLAREIKEAMAGGRQAGYSESLAAMLTEVLRSHLTLKKRMLRDFSTRTKVDRFRDDGKRQARQSSPIPISPGKRDLVLLATGIYPVYFHNRTTRLISQRRGLAAYLDVSGSVNAVLPKIIGILRNLRNDISTVYLFSNQVVETPFTDLVDKGKVETTYGTDFDCIAESILEKGFEKAVVITDGYASMNDDNQAKLKKAGVRILTVLFGSKRDCGDFEPFGPVMPLDEVVEVCGVK